MSRVPSRESARGIIAYRRWTCYSKAQRSSCSNLDPTTQSPTIETSLGDIFSRLCIQASLCGRLRSPLPIDPPTLCLDPALSKIPFATLLEARNAINIIINDAHGFVRSAMPFKYSLVPISPGGLRETRETVLAQLGSWKQRFDQFMITSLPALKVHELHGSAVLLIFHHITLIWVSTSLTPQETAWDEHTEQFEIIISLSASLTGTKLSKISSTVSKEPKQLLNRLTLHDIFTFEMGAMSAIYFTALKC